MLYEPHGPDRKIAPFIDTRSEEAFEGFLAAARHAADDATVYATISAGEKAEIDAAIARLDRGEGVPYADVKARIARKLAR